jgi:hypothetical protein
MAVQPYAGYLVGQQFVKGPLSSSLSVLSAPLYGVQVSLPLAPSASLTGGIGYASGDLQAGLPIIGGVSFGSAATTLFDAGVELRLGSAGRLIPLAQLGGGATHRRVTVAGIHASTTDLQVSGGLGVDMPLSSNLALRLMAKDYYGKADFGSLGTIRASTDDVHALALTGGIRFAF